MPVQARMYFPPQDIQKEIGEQEECHELLQADGRTRDLPVGAGEEDRGQEQEQGQGQGWTPAPICAGSGDPNTDKEYLEKAHRVNTILLQRYGFIKRGVMPVQTTEHSRGGQKTDRLRMIHVILQKRA